MNNRRHGIPFTPSTDPDAVADLACPRCGDPHTHVDEVMAGAASGDAVTLRYNGEEGYRSRIALERETLFDNDMGYRHNIMLYGTCESGCTFQFRLKQHKGATNLFITSQTRQWNDGA